MSEKKSSEQSEAFDIHIMEAKVSSDPSNEGVFCVFSRFLWVRGGFLFDFCD